MANEIAGQGVTGRTAYFRLYNNVNQIWNTAGTPAFEAYNAANITDYDTAMTELGATGYYAGTIPAVVAGAYSAVCYYRAGGSPAESDTPFAGGDIQWSGSVIEALSSILHPTTAGRTLDVTATGAAGIDWGNVENPTTTVGLSGTTVGVVTLVTTVTTVTNQLTAAAIATGVWTDTTAGDFTTALSIGKSVMNGVTLGTGLTVARCTLTDTLTTYTGNTVQTGDVYALANGANGFVAIKADTAAIKTKTDFLPSATAGAAGGVFIAGSNAATTFDSMTVTNATTLSGAVSLGSTLGVTGTTTFAAINTGAVTVTTFASSGTVTFNAFTVTNALIVSGTTTLTGAVTAANNSNDIDLGAAERSLVAVAVMASVIETGITLTQAIQIIGATTAGASSGGPANPTFVGLDGATNRVVGTADASGNRIGIIYSV